MSERMIAVGKYAVVAVAGFVAALLTRGLLVMVVGGGGDLKLPTSVQGAVGDYIQIEAKASGTVRWYSPDADLQVLPQALLRDSRFAIVSGRKPGRYRLIAVTAHGGMPSEFAECEVVVGNVPPGPGPKPNPDPKPNPKVDKLYVVVVEETVTSAENRGAYFNDAPLAKHLSSKGWPFKVADKDVKDPSGNTPSYLVPYINAARDANQYPRLFLVNQEGRPLYEGPLPGTPADLLKLIIQVGG